MKFKRDQDTALCKGIYSLYENIGDFNFDAKHHALGTYRYRSLVEIHCLRGKFNIVSSIGPKK